LELPVETCVKLMIAKFSGATGDVMRGCACDAAPIPLLLVPCGP
jgi:hypothetical protein